MADWSSLKPLKNHSTIMSLVAIALAAILVLTPRHAFRAQADINTAANNSAPVPTVNATGGLSIRQQPSVSGRLLITAPNHAVLTILDNNAGEDYISGANGHWFKVVYQGVTGYAWGNYIDQ